MVRGGAKRVLDLVLALLLGLLLAPVLALCSVAIRWRDGAPVLFRQERVGREGRRFRICKFRTMSPATGTQVTAAGDLRITPLGRLLRRTKLDELPQLWNVFRGEMTLVGPRPEVPHYVDRHVRLFRGIASLRPGITDWASLAFRDEEEILARHRDDAAFYEGVLLPRKVALARLYGRHTSLGLDLRLILATALAVLRVEGSVQMVAGRRMLERGRWGIAHLRGP